MEGPTVEGSFFSRGRIYKAVFGVSTEGNQTELSVQITTRLVTLVLLRHETNQSKLSLVPSPVNVNLTLTPIPSKGFLFSHTMVFRPLYPEPFLLCCLKEVLTRLGKKGPDRLRTVERPWNRVRPKERLSSFSE